MLTKEEKIFLLKLSRKVLNSIFTNESVNVNESELTPNLREKRGAFVTLTYKNTGDLRGCIGYIEGILPLYKTVIENTINAALKDPRFPQVEKEEVEKLHIEISAMTPIKELKNIEDIEVGKHGLIVEKGFFKGLLLPQVATEYGWDKYTFLSHTCLKAGLPPDEWKKPGIKIFVFSAEVFGEKEFENEL